MDSSFELSEDDDEDIEVICLAIYSSIIGITVQALINKCDFSFVKITAYILKILQNIT